MGKLNVYTWSPNNISKHLWSKEGNQGQDWLSASITIVSDKPFAVVFEGVRGATYASDIAIDDIKYLDGSCETQTTPSVGIVTQPPTPGNNNFTFLSEFRKLNIFLLLPRLFFLNVSADVFSEVLPVFIIW